MKGHRKWRNACVTRAQPVAGNVRLIEFSVEGDLPPFDPGSHVDVIVETGGATAIRSYTCLPAPAGHVRVAVKLHEHGRGGSRHMWSLIEGAKARLTAPVNRFEPSWRAPAYLPVAGGIGVTPIYGPAEALAMRGAPVRLAYGGRTLADMPFAEELSNYLGEGPGLSESAAKSRIDLKREIANLPEGGEVYVCGPLAMLEDARARWRAAGRPVSRFRCEDFGDSGQLPEIAFSVAVANSNLRVNVRPDQSMLQAAVEAGVDMICLVLSWGMRAVRRRRSGRPGGDRPPRRLFQRHAEARVPEDVRLRLSNPRGIGDDRERISRLVRGPNDR